MKATATRLATEKPKRPRTVRSIAWGRSREEAKVSARLLTIPNASPIVIAAAYMIHKAAQPQNHWIGDNLCNDNLQPYKGVGALWIPGIRLCTSYQVAMSRRARKRVQAALSSLSLVLGERRIFLTLTATTISGIGLERTLDLWADAWRRLLKTAWWRDQRVRGGVKGIEFTLGDSKRLNAEDRDWNFDTDGFHVHIHAVVISPWIDWIELGEVWTSCFLKAAAKRSIAVPITTSHGRLIVQVKEVTNKNGRRTISPEHAILEVCKYVTKGSCWLDMPDSELSRSIEVLRGKRMIEVFGECAQRGSHRDSSEAGSVDPNNLDTQDTSGRNRSTGGRGVLPPAKPPRRRSILKLGAEMIGAGQLNAWISQVLDPRVKEVQDYRREKFGERQPYGSFSTLENEEWYGTVLEKSMARARACVNLFSSVGVEKFAATMLQDTKTIGSRVALYKLFDFNDALKCITGLVNRNWTHAESLILRPICSHLIQVDDCDWETVERLRPCAFLIVETSSGSYQVWLALPADTQKSERDLIRTRLFKVLTGIDKSASGAMRWPGSINHKAGRNWFRVRIVSSRPSRIVTVPELEVAGLLAALPKSTKVRESSRPPNNPSSGRLLWPDYERCLREAPIKSNGLPDVSKADNKWCILALGRGWPETAVESKLCELSEKARVRSDYARLTVTYAASIVARSEGIRPVFAEALQELRSANHEHARV